MIENVVAFTFDDTNTQVTLRKVQCFQKKIKGYSKNVCSIQNKCLSAFCGVHKLPPEICVIPSRFHILFRMRKFNENETQVKIKCIRVIRLRKKIRQV